MGGDEKALLVTVHSAKLPTSKKDEHGETEFYVKINDDNSQNKTGSKPGLEMTWGSVIGIMTEAEKLNVSLVPDGEDTPFASAEIETGEVFAAPTEFHKQTVKLVDANGDTCAKLILSLCHMPGLQVQDEDYDGEGAPAADEEAEFSDE